MKKSRWHIIHEDDHLLVIDKPAGLLTIPDRFDASIDNLYDSLKKYKGEVYINHRLDKDTSGLIVFSKDEATHKAMSELFENREVEKIYLAILKNVPDIESGKIEMPIRYTNSMKRAAVIDPAGKPATTLYQVLDAFRRFSLVKCKIETGRMHQIRVHMQSIYCPVLCDPMYGDGHPFYLSEVKPKYRKNKYNEERPLISRTALHAHQLSFLHPATKEQMHFEQELPKDMNAVVNQLRKLNND